MDVAKFYLVEFKKKAWKYSLLKHGVKRVDSPFSVCIVMRADKCDPSARLWEAVDAAKTAAVGKSEWALQRSGFQLIMLVNGGAEVIESNPMGADNAEASSEVKSGAEKIAASIEKLSAVQDVVWISCGLASDDLTAALALFWRRKVSLAHHWVHCYQPRSTLLPLVNMAEPMNYVMSDRLAHTKVPNVLGSIHRLVVIFYRLKHDRRYRKEYAVKDIKLHVSAVIRLFISAYFLIFILLYLIGLDVLWNAVIGAFVSASVFLSIQLLSGYFLYRKGIDNQGFVLFSEKNKS
ncbi:hypothetical protein R50072_07680 [Simiduia litorea]|uniref:hypothetical protein n=1 Tax=Simiduia litorea TaxID=1435348 RepID=UPI0036F3870D